MTDFLQKFFASLSINKYFLVFLFAFTLGSVFLLTASLAEASSYSSQAIIEEKETDIQLHKNTNTSDKNYYLTKSKSKPVLKRLLKKRPVITPVPAEVPAVQSESFPLPERESVFNESISFSPPIFVQVVSPRAP